ncbi:MAG: RsiV family protein [Prevotellaceae bacterium]|nr:RsiV family protein [Prevotellaceae bacterium]
MNTKKIIPILAAGILIFASCGQSSKSNSKSSNSSSTTENLSTTATVAEDETPQPPFLFEVISKKAYFYEMGDDEKPLKSFVVKGDKGGIFELSSGQFGIVEYTNAKGIKTAGWLKLQDLKFCFAAKEELKFRTVILDEQFKGSELIENSKIQIDYHLVFTYPAYYPDSKILDKLRNQMMMDCFDEYGFSSIYEDPEVLPYRYFCHSREELINPPIDPEDREEYLNGEYDFLIERTCNIMRLYGDLLQYSTGSYTYTGGAHGSYSTVYHTFDLQSGKPVLFDDIFKKEKKQDVIKIIIAEFLKQNDFKSLKEAMYQDEENYDPKDNIRIDEKGLVFHYGLYAIDCYAAGEQDIFIPYNKLLPYIKTNSPLYKIASKK